MQRSKAFWVRLWVVKPLDFNLLSIPGVSHTPASKFLVKARRSSADSAKLPPRALTISAIKHALFWTS